MNLLRGLLLENMGLKLVALLLAFVVYLHVYTERPAVMTVAFALFPLIRTPWEGLLLNMLAGAGSGSFWPSQSALLNTLTPRRRRHAAYADRRALRHHQGLRADHAGRSQHHADGGQGGVAVQFNQGPDSRREFNRGIRARPGENPRG